MIDLIKQWIKIRLTYVQHYIKMYRTVPSAPLNKNIKYAFIFFAADYNNLGDIAITVAQERFIRNVLGESVQIIKITESETFGWVRKIKKLPRENVLITLIGGGNNGSLYEFIEGPRRFVLRNLRKYKIVSFPQTVVFENTLRAQPYKREFIKLCKNCADLSLVARERNSYDFYKEIKGIRVLLTPDIVFSLPYSHSAIRDVNAVALILRCDKEKLLDSATEKKMVSAAKSNFSRCYMWDTCDVEFEYGHEEEILEHYLAKLSAVSLAITDRLHGMILCYITKTPCIVIDNNNRKISSTFYTWLEKQNFVKMFDMDNDIDVFLRMIKKMSKETITQEDLLTKFKLLEEVLRL